MSTSRRGGSGRSGGSDRPSPKSKSGSKSAARSSSQPAPKSAANGLRPTLRTGQGAARPAVPRPRGSRSLAKTRTSPISALGGLAVVVVVLLIGLGYGYATRPTAKTVADTSVRQLPVATASAVCQAITGSGADSSTTLSEYTPGTGAVPGPKDTAAATYLDNGSAGPIKIGAPGTRAESAAINAPRVLTNSSGFPWPVPVTAQATGAFAPGFSVGEVLRTDTGPARGLAATPCTGPGTDFWFAGVSLGADRQSRLYLTNSDNADATVNLTFYGPDGAVDTGTGGQNIDLPAGTSQMIVLNTFVAAPPTEAAALRVQTALGRVSASVLDVDANGAGMDFIPAQGPNAPGQSVQVIPGVANQPAKITLTLTATGTSNASLDKIEWITDNTIVPAGVQLPLSVPMGKTVTVDLTKIPNAGETGSFRLTSSGGSMLAGLRIVAAGSPGDTAYLAPAQPITSRSVLTDDKQGGKAVSTLYLTSLGKKGSTVQLTRIGNSGAPAVTSVTVPAGQTVAVPLASPVPGQTDFTTVVDVQPGSDPVYGSRQISDQPTNGGTQVTLQDLVPARMTAAVPPVAADLSGAVDR